MGWVYVVLVSIVLSLAGYRLASSEKPFAAENALWALGLFALPFIPMLSMAVYGSTPPGLIALLILVCGVVIFIGDVALMMLVAGYMKSRDSKEAERAKWIVVQVSVVAFLALLGAIVMGSLQPVAHFIMILYVYGVYLVSEDACRKATGKGLM